MKALGAFLTLNGLMAFEDNKNLIQEYFVPHLPSGMITGGFTGEEFENMLLMKCWGLEVLYPNGELFGNMLDSWAAMYENAWQSLWDNQERIIEATGDEEYSETEERTGNENENVNRSGSETGTDGNLINRTIKDAGTNDSSSSRSVQNIASGDDVTTTMVSGFNSDGFVNRDKTTVDYGKNDNSTESTTGNEEIDLTREDNSTNELRRNMHTTDDSIRSKNDIDNKVREYTKKRGLDSLDVMERQRKYIRDSVADIICDMFKEMFCLMVY